MTPVSDFELSRTMREYLQRGTVRSAAESLGISGQAVSKRLTLLGVETPPGRRRNGANPLERRGQILSLNPDYHRRMRELAGSRDNVEDWRRNGSRPPILPERNGSADG